MFYDWAERFLTQPSSKLGRDGPVCPYVRPALQRDLLWSAYIPGRRPPLDRLRTITQDALDLYSALPTEEENPTAVLRAIVTVFPDMQDYTLIDTIHREFKSNFVDRGLMLGQFYPGCDQPGLWNKDFRPLNAPLPLLVVRTMMTTDFPFLLERPEWMNAYVRKFAPLLPAHVRSVVVGRLTARSDAEVPAYDTQPE
jgi:hypothetical protein